MSDRRLRELERRLTAGDLSIEPMLITERVRAGKLPIELVRVAAHLGYGPAQATDPGPVMYPCDCPPNSIGDGCSSCEGTGTISLSARGLIETVRRYPLERHILFPWAVDCVRRAVDRLEENHTDRAPFLRILDCVIKWVAIYPLPLPALDTAALRAQQMPSLDYTEGAVQALALGVFYCNRPGREDSIWRAQVAKAVSRAYKALGYKRSERAWQINRLAHYLLLVEDEKSDEL